MRIPLRIHSFLGGASMKECDVCVRGKSLTEYKARASMFAPLSEKIRRLSQTFSGLRILNFYGPADPQGLRQPDKKRASSRTVLSCWTVRTLGFITSLAVSCQTVACIFRFFAGAIPPLSRNVSRVILSLRAVQCGRPAWGEAAGKIQARTSS